MNNKQGFYVSWFVEAFAQASFERSKLRIVGRSVMESSIKAGMLCNLFHWEYVRLMSRKALSYLLLVMIALQSVVAMADVHPVDYADTATYSSMYTDGASSEILHSSTATDLVDQKNAADEFHCHHAGCHCHVYLSGNLAYLKFLQIHSMHNDYRAFTPEAPSSPLYRPPIA